MRGAARTAGAGSGLPAQQRRTIFRHAKYKDLKNPDMIGDLRKETLQLYRDCISSCGYLKSQYGLSTPVPMMKQRIRMAFELNKNVRDPVAHYMLLLQAWDDLDCALGMVYTSSFYLQAKYFGPQEETTFLGSVEAYQGRELLQKQKAAREERMLIALGEREHPLLPGRSLNEDGSTNYSHPKGPLPQGESEVFARPPPFNDWGKYPMPDPWNPANRPEGPPNPFLIEQMDQQYKVMQARMGPYNRHRLRRFVQHETRTRDMSDAEYLEYFRENEVHMLANKFELPEYAWAEERIGRRYARASSENRAVFGPAQAEWVDKYKNKFKAVNYFPAVDYWCMSFKQWIPNYNKYIVENVDRMRGIWNEWVSTPAHYAAWRSPQFAELSKDPERNPLALSMSAWAAALAPGSAKSATRPYDHPGFENKWYTDNGLACALILKGDAENGIGVPHGSTSVLRAELGRLKDEIGCVQLTEQRFSGEWWNRGQIKLLSALATKHDMELAEAMLAAAGVSATASRDEAAKQLAAHDWSSFRFSGYSYLRYPDGDAQGVHSWPDCKERWPEVFRSIHNYEQCVPAWFQGLSQRATGNKPVTEGGWTLPSDPIGHWDQVVSY
eukprot:TRINITY_DN50152_c0_g1_i1.p1 TRINITY_DN50152_c0_g1~~TRINITY_DN50152_c0_g1_i1.p1  ORF type:complete len:646 (+),score=249.67 TRINITY_DN50152_c0_g1_i1:106-1938(+)